MLTELDSTLAQPDSAEPEKAVAKLPDRDASYALPGAPQSTDKPAPRERRRPARSHTWVQRVTGEDLAEQAAQSAKKMCCGRVPTPPKSLIRAAKVLIPLVAIGVLTTLGNIAYAALEADSEQERAARYQEFLNEILATTNISRGQFETLLSFTGQQYRPLDEGAAFYDNGRIGGASEYAYWGFPNYHTFYFSFSIVSTIGYGSIVPTTVGGKLFTIIFSLLGIPFCVTAVSICAAEVLYLFELLAVSRMDQVSIAFKSYDSDSSGTLDMSEFRAALSDLGINPEEEDFQKLIDEIDDDHSRTLDIKEFRQAATLLRLPIGRVARTKVRLQISVLVSICWLFLGMFIMTRIEGWDYLDSFYFAVMTLTTVGLGDFVPSSRPGTVFGFFYCMVGLGLIALLVTAIGEFSEAVKNKAEKKAAAAVVKAASKAATASKAVGKGSGKLLKRSKHKEPGPTSVGEEVDGLVSRISITQVNTGDALRMDGTAVVR